MPRALKGRMPRTFGDHRTTLAKRLRVIYDDIGSKYPLNDGISRKVAAITAQTWLNYEECSREVTHLTGRKRVHEKQATILNRIRRRQSVFASQFLGGLRTLSNLTGTGDGADLAKSFQQSLEDINS